MKALTVQPPWAWLFFAEYWAHVPEDRRTLGPGGPPLTDPKDVENRNNSPVLAQLRDYRGPLVIHAGKTLQRDWCDWFGLNFTCIGAALGVVDVVGVRFRAPVTRKTYSPWHQTGNGIYVENPQLFATPLLWRGQLSVFEIPDESLPPLRTGGDLPVPPGSGVGEVTLEQGIRIAEKVAELATRERAP